MIYKADVLVIGGGGAGLRAAIAAYERAYNSKKNIKIIIAVKGRLGACGTTALAYSDRMAFHVTLPTTSPRLNDNWKYHARDIYEIGGFVSDYDLAEVLAKNSSEAYYYLEKLGVPFVKENDIPSQFVTDGSIYARACFTGPDTAVQIEQALMKRISKIKEIEVLENVMVSDLIVANNKVFGAVGFIDEHEIIILAKSVILATGGAGEIYGNNVYPIRMTGDGYAMALRAGAELVNMEFIQIGLASPKTKIACSGSIMRCIPRFINENGEEFLINYGITFYDIFEKGSTWPISAEHKTWNIDVAVFREIMRGNRVFLDFKQNPSGFKFEYLRDDLKKKYYDEIKELTSCRLTPIDRLQEINPQTIKWFSERGIDLKKDLLEIKPSIQHFQGGVKIRQKAQTNVAGLYACGECAGGQHGANRPGGNSLLDTQVFGKIAGENAFEFSLSVDLDEDVGLLKARYIFESYKDFISQSGIKLEKAKEKLRNIMDLYASVIRYPDGLQIALDIINELKAKQIKPIEYTSLLEFKNMLLTSESIVKSCILRKESRGPHLMFERYDDLLPKPRNEKYNFYHVCKLDNKKNEIEVNRIEPIKPQDLEAI
ncbi:FAD-binding protein [Thermoanaerobacterium sp. RBIITD]|uniref:FAD-binding protein n=1 Tax=Thermoanaerobacterium sp. RBIITD TaxID=1550240 RepID=UPI000BC08365|nr:FAD-binding protein [Thermoanaerobacterium sp. RBIITD]SNX53406.1 succinate dehydrogenase / fumarate reductase flavoprotein subunit [Thermoanaerobacterium sp. RBIITD]